MPRLLLFFLVICLGCTQSEEVQTDGLLTNSDDYFQFGTVGGFCPTPCNVAYKLGNNVFFENTNPQNPTDFSKATLAKLPDTKLALAKDLLAQLPPELLQFDNKQFGTSKVIVDGQDYVIELKSKGKVYRWQMPTAFDSRDTVPDYVRLFQRRVDETLAQLKKM
ncbi:hypothetical protein [Runella sp.]|uniref:hypothetical protein n=1 Tax=Runella sp. TaxID=1960881 RepID=UPI003D0B0E6B